MDQETLVWSMEIDQNKENIDVEAIEDEEWIESILAEKSMMIINSPT